MKCSASGISGRRIGPSLALVNLGNLVRPINQTRNGGSCPCKVLREEIHNGIDAVVLGEGGVPLTVRVRKTVGVNEKGEVQGMITVWPAREGDQSEPRFVSWEKSSWLCIYKYTTHDLEISENFPIRHSRT